MPSLTDPFTTGTSLQAASYSKRFPIARPDSAYSTPIVTANVTATITSTDIANVGTALSSILLWYNPSVMNPFNMTPQQNTAVNYVQTLFGTVTTGPWTFTVTDLENIVIVSQMVRAWSGVNINLMSTTDVANNEGVISTVSITTSGNNYIQGTYPGIQLTGGSGSGATAEVTVNVLGNVSNVVMETNGFGYHTGDVLTCLNTDLSSANGSGFTCTVNTLSSVVPVRIGGAFPNGATTVICNDGYFIAEQAGTGQWLPSIPQDGSQWQPLATNTMETRSDTVNAIDQFSGGYVIIFGQKSLEFWSDQSTQPSPYQRASGAQQDYGLAAKWSRTHFQGGIAFLGQNFEGEAQVMVIAGGGTQPQVISTPDINNIINSFVTVNDALAYSFFLDGHEIYRITFPTGNRTFDFDATTGIWNEAQSGLNEYNRHLTSLGYSYNYCSYASDCVNGNIYYLNSNDYTDNGSFIRREATTIHLNDGGNEFGISEVYLNMEIGKGTQLPTTGDSNTPQITMQVSRDYGNTFENPRPCSIGKVGQYKGPRVVWNRLGSSKDFVLKFIQTSAVPFVIKSGSFTVRRGKKS